MMYCRPVPAGIIDKAECDGFGGLQSGRATASMTSWLVSARAMTGFGLHALATGLAALRTRSRRPRSSWHRQMPLAEVFRPAADYAVAGDPDPCGSFRARITARAIATLSHLFVRINEGLCGRREEMFIVLMA